jgi:hypothetical protein
MGFWSDPIGNTIKAVKEAVTGGGSSDDSSSTSGSSSRKGSKVSGSTPATTEPTGSGANLLTDGMSWVHAGSETSSRRIKKTAFVNGQTVNRAIGQDFAISAQIGRGG